MTINEYMDRVIALFKSGEATPEQWSEMARAVLYASEGGGETDAIDAVCLPEGAE